ncbi:MAG TPA: asparaginase [Casimicrobium sp.]|nr:asparaginase [Casimicrobium sp.]
MKSTKPRILILATGGTIAGAATSSASISSYTSAVTGIDQIVAAVPDIKRVADVTGEQVLQIGSESFNNERLLLLARRVSAAVKSDDVDGVVITHGTDTMEETAYFLNLCIRSDKPIVLTGSMRPGTALSADGPLNLLNAVIVSGHRDAAGKGVLVVMNDEIHSARDVYKSDAFRTDSFLSLYGPLGLVIDGSPRFYRLPARPHTLRSEFDIDAMTELAPVGVVYTHGNMSRSAYDACVSDGAQAVIHMGFGGGTVPDYIAPVLAELRQRGVIILRTTRTSGGALSRNGAIDDDANDYVVADDQNGPKARLLMALALTKTRDTLEIQRIFWRY